MLDEVSLFDVEEVDTAVVSVSVLALLLVSVAVSVLVEGVSVVVVSVVVLVLDPLFVLGLDHDGNELKSMDVALVVVPLVPHEFLPLLEWI